jgi:signal transduction histidine kinase
VPDLPDEVQVALYRIAQEALNNIVKHAQARRAEVRLWCSRAEMPNPRPLDDGAREAVEPVASEPQGAQQAAGEPRIRVVLTIEDDGRGFDPAAAPLDHLGLGIIHERSQAIGATLRIESRSGRGTVVEVDWETS